MLETLRRALTLRLVEPQVLPDFFLCLHPLQPKLKLHWRFASRRFCFLLRFSPAFSGRAKPSRVYTVCRPMANRPLRCLRGFVVYAFSQIGLPSSEAFSNLLPIRDSALAGSASSCGVDKGKRSSAIRSESRSPAEDLLVIRCIAV
jgi:hypothetical protein